MKKSRLVSIVVCFALLVSMFSLTAFAVTFDDVENDATVSWAKESINKMTDAGYIKGYEDGTFKPYNPITKIESLILMSRMLGYEDSKFAPVVKNAKSMYKTVAQKYNASYSGELSYLLYCGILKESELVDYASTANANTQLLRYQAAMLMSKLLGADAEAKAFTVSEPTYADNIAIPQVARPYVEYVTAEKIMNGMDATAEGLPQFSPVTTLTRAQMATLLARIMDKLDVKYVKDEVSNIKEASIKIGGKAYPVTKATKVYVDDADADILDVEDGADATLVSICGNALVVESEASKEVTTVYGIIKSRNESTGTKKITIADYENQKDTADYVAKDDCKVYIDNTKANFVDLSVGDFVKLTLTGSKVTQISTEDKSSSIQGTLVASTYDNDNHVFFEVEDEDENVNTYVASSKGVTIKRDGEEADVKDLSKGDTVTLTLSYGKVTRIVAKGKTESIEGLLTEIIISNNPALTITKDGKSKTYKLRSDATITVAGAKGSIYDLRPNITVTGTLNSDEIKTLAATTIVVDQGGEITGTVTGKNTTYKVITIKDDSDNIHSIYYNSGTTFLNSNGSATTYKALEEGTKVSITGAYKNGVFEATIIIVK